MLYHRAMRIVVCGLLIACGSLAWPQIQVQEIDTGSVVETFKSVSYDGSIALFGRKLYHRNGTVITLPSTLLGRSVTPLEISGDGNCVLYSASGGVIHQNRTTGVSTLATSAGTPYNSAGMTYDGSQVFLTNNIGYFKWTLNDSGLFALVTFPPGTTGVGGQTSLLGTSSIFVTAQSGLVPVYRVWKYTPSQGAILLPYAATIFSSAREEVNISADGGVYTYYNIDPLNKIILNRFSNDAPLSTSTSGPAQIAGLTFNGNAGMTRVMGMFWRRDIGNIEARNFINSFYETPAFTDLQFQKLRISLAVLGFKGISPDCTTFWGLGRLPGTDEFSVISAYNPLTFRKQTGEKFRVTAKYTTRSIVSGPLETDDASPNLLEVYYDLNSSLLSPTAQSTLSPTNMKPQTSLSFSGQPGFIWTFGAQNSVPFSYHIKDADPTGPIDSLMLGTANITLSDLRSGSKVITSSNGTLSLTFTLVGPVHDPNT
jgi:hypothetical protein